MLKAAIQTYKLSKKQTLIKFCDTRWSEKANCIENFLELLLAIVAVLDELRLETVDVVLLFRSYDKFSVVCKSLQKIDSGIISSMQPIKYLLKNIEKWLDEEGVGSYESICIKFYIDHEVIDASIDSNEAEFEIWKEVIKDTKSDILITKLLNIAQDTQLHGISQL
uniref:Uncharacterized protein n=1 Tax=Panagrolaimus davidi TaxID=227884 RepID=A0A914PBT5_9BILA